MYTKIVNNGVNVEALLAAREALTAAPEGAGFQWRASCKWINGTHSHSEIEHFRGLGADQAHKRRFRFDADHPEIFAAEDKGATPVEYILVGLASCLTAGVASVAQHRNIQLNAVQATIEGDFQGIRVIFDIDADATAEDIEAVVAQSQKRSAVYDIITNPTVVIVETRP
jgi:uncharacterized OsmC-like protein